MSKLNTRALLFGGIGIFALIIVLIVTGVIPGLKKSGTPQISGNIVIWTVGEGDDLEKTAWTAMLKKFNAVYPKVQVTRRNFDSPDVYESAVLDGLASGNGPDVLMVLNHALPRYANKIVPAPETIFPLSRLRNDFPKIVEADFAPQGKIYGIPFSIDTMALIYNRSILDQSAVSPPESWEDFEIALQSLTKRDATGISFSGAAMGTAENVPYASDILSLLMLQSGVKMTNSEFTRSTFDSGQEGPRALEFYTQFANAGSSAYTWNASLPNALDSFGQEKVAMVFGYHETLKDLRAKNPFIDIGVSEMPSPERLITSGKKVNYPRYYAFAVSRQSKSPELAWQFILATVGNNEIAGSYMLTTKNPPALRSLLILNKDDANIGVFSRQALTSLSWAQIDNTLVEQLFSSVITSVNEGRETSEDALRRISDELSRAMQKKF